jgi:hypothetical protein
LACNNDDQKYQRTAFSERRAAKRLTGKSATLSTGETFEDITEQRTVELDIPQVEAVVSQTGGNHVGVL